MLATHSNFDPLPFVVRVVIIGIGGIIAEPTARL
jgi:hypothetical protein